MTQPAFGADGARGRFPAAILALDIGASHLRSALVTADGTVAGRRQATLPRADAEAVTAACLGLLRDSLADARPDSRPVALVIAAAGPVDQARGTFVDPPNLPRSLWGYPLAGVLSEALGLPARIERDTVVAALAEGAFGAARGAADYIYLTVSTGIGGAVVADGRPLRGADGTAGELGHLSVDIDGPPCGCGARGHLEAIASGSAIARAAREAGLGELEAADVARAEEAGDERAAAIMGRARDAFAAAAVSIVDVFNPALIVIGGGVAIGQGERLLGPARERVAREAFRTAAARVQIVPAALGDDVGLVGGVALIAQVGSVESVEAEQRAGQLVA
jgi:glucokinase